MADFGDVDPDTGQTNTRTTTQGTVDPYAPSVYNGQITPEQYAEYQKQRRRAAIMGILSVIGGMTALGGVGAAIGGGGSAAAGSLGTIPGGAPWAITPYAAPVAASGTGLAAGVGTGLATGALASGTGTAAAVGTGVGTGVGAGTGVGTAAATGAGWLGLTAKEWAAILASLGSTVGTAVSNNNNGSPTSPSSVTTDPNMQQLIAMMQKRITKSEPLYDSILSMANGLLPIQYQKGGGGNV